ncbi:probable dolichyl pyrophosphate Man9GlcNAc2 alpha-1,3-glucosyltransferase isoform X2 [Citrus clementina]|uniref:probable dolichyl pyrophosphate Man9GlcNAc2 alpha-1,3-glucosyltransferase isoform X2 n=1 Tax=Citrus clementina TaxID=85681 RepID=UPI000CED5E06|nr:probable dolichyl pyrophosphate Man9GlcNAc2 alpha-1,3-glucosyltransferase isoform X2 [Citrus x clementina]
MGKKKEKKELNEKVDVEAVEIEDDTWWWLTHKGIGATFLCISVFALLVRVAVSLHPYSGAGSPPKFGDYEAQRHWMEITLNLPVLEWYRNSTGNDLSYWGLDYPPLTAYQSYFHGLFLRFFDPDSVSLFTSRGYETYVGKLLMRWTVLSSDTLIFFPAIFYFAFVYHSSCHSSRKNDCAWHIAMLLLNPCLILIDHGHFQYNCISLGLTVAAIAAILSQRELLASCLFTLALSHKQVLSRLAPFERGIYEDYVANFWCTSSVIIKWKRLFSVHSLKFISLTATVLTCLPSMVQQVMAPSSRGFLYGLLNSSFAFYLFSFQVHEKSILLPLLPASLLALEERRPFKWLMFYGLFSMFPLLCRDKLVLPYFALHALFMLLYHAPCGHGGRPRNARPNNTKFDYFDSFKTFMNGFIYLSSFILHIVYLTMHPPEKFPYLFEAIIMLICFYQFALFAFYTNVKQWSLLEHSTTEEEKKLI